MAPAAEFPPATSSGRSLIEVRASGADDRPWIATAARDVLGSERQAYLERGVFTVTDFPALIAEFDTAPVGFLCWEIEGDVAETIAIACTERRMGAGRALMTAFHNLAASAGCDRLKVVTTDTNEGARVFYERLGYEIVEVRKGAVDECRRTLKPEIPPDMHDEIEYGRPLEVP